MRFRLLVYLVPMLLLVLGIERVTSVNPAFLWKNRAGNEVCEVYRSLHRHMSSLESRAILRSGTTRWRDTLGASIHLMLPGQPPQYPAPDRFDRGLGGIADPRRAKEEFTVDTSGYFPQVMMDRSLFIRHCFEDRQANFFDGFGWWLNVREAMFGSFDVKLWELSPVGISQDGRNALVYAESSCGSWCGAGEFFLFERRGNEWVVVGASLQWIS